MKEKNAKMPVLLSTHFIRPMPSQILIPRERLLSLVQSFTCQGITVIYAPAGYGKTSLVLDWAEKQSDPVGWISLDMDANNSLRFWGYLVAAIQHSFPAFPQKDLFAALLSEESQTFVMLLINAIHALPKRVFLVFDDLHILTNEEILSVFQYFCLNLPANCRLILISRKKLSISLSRLQAEGRLHLITKSDLHFTKEEVKRIFGQKGIELPDSDLDLLMEKTEGWPIGVRLIMLSMDGKNTIHSVLQHISHHHSLVGDYFTEELLSKLKPDIREFLVLSSILPQLSPELCNIVLDAAGFGESNSAAILAFLWEEQLFIDRIASDQYRYHPLFRESLLDKLHTEQFDLYPTLCTAACEWYEKHGEYGTAAEMAVSNKNYLHAADIIERNYDKMVMEGESFLLNRWIDALPDEIINLRPRFHLAKAWALLPGGRMEEAEAHLKLAEQKIAANVTDEAQEDTSPLVSCEIAAIHALNYAMIRYDCRSSLRYSEEAKRLLPRDGDGQLSGITNLARGVSRVLGSDPYSAEIDFQKVLKSPENLRSIFLSFFGKYYMAVLAQKKGKLRRSANLLYDALRITKNEQGQERSISSIAHISLAKIYYEWNQLDECLHHVQTGLELSKEWSLPMNVSAGYHILTLINQIQGDMEAALVASRHSTEPIGENYASILTTHESLHTLRQRVSLGLIDESVLWADKYLYSIEKNQFIRGEKLWEVPAAVRLSIASGESRNLADILDNLLTGASNIGFYHQVIETQVLRAIIFYENKKTDKAILALANALEFAQYEGYMRMFLDEGEPMRNLLEEARKQRIAPVYTKKLLQAFDNDIDGDRLPEALTKRELEVLRLLADGYKPKKIAQELFITIGTTRNHLHHIYEKLGVSNQIQAINLARKQKLI